MFGRRAFLVLLMLSAFLAGCGNNSDPEPFSPEYLENFLETCYGTDFSYIGEFGSEDNDAEGYVFSDSEGIETVVKQSQREVVLGARYSITDYYIPAKLAADKEIQKKLDDSGFEYTFQNSDGIVCGVYMNIGKYDDIPKAAEVLHDIADNYRVEKDEKAADFSKGNYRFGHMAPHIELRDENDRYLAYINIPSTEDGEYPNIISLPEFITAAQDKYDSYILAFAKPLAALQRQV